MFMWNFTFSFNLYPEQKDMIITNTSNEVLSTNF